MKKKIKYFLEEKNPLVIARRNKMRRRLKNKTPSFLCPNCIGGILFHDLGLRFQSPTVNLMITQKDFVRFVLNMDAYLAGKFEFFEHESYTCPCAYLTGEGLEKIAIHFTHYHSPEEAVKKWKERAKRIDRDNLFVYLQERDGLTREEIQALASLQLKGLIVFTAHNYEDIPYALQIPEYEAAGEVGNILTKSWLDGTRKYEKHFDFVSWFNEANGTSYDVRDYQIRQM